MTLTNLVDKPFKNLSELLIMTLNDLGEASSSHQIYISTGLQASCCGDTESFTDLSVQLMGCLGSHGQLPKFMLKVWSELANKMHAHSSCLLRGCGIQVRELL